MIDLSKQIEDLAVAAAGFKDTSDQGSLKAMQYSQAALNLANAMVTAATVQPSGKEG